MDGIIHQISEYDNKYMNLFNFCLLLASTAEKETKYDMFKHHTTSAHYLLLTHSTCIQNHRRYWRHDGVGVV